MGYLIHILSYKESCQTIIVHFLYHFFVQNFEICTFPLFLAHLNFLKFSQKNIIGFSTFFSKNDQITYRLPKGGPTDSGKVLLNMKQAEGVPIKQLSRL